MGKIQTHELSLGSFDMFAINDYPPLHSYKASSFFSTAPADELQAIFNKRGLDGDKLLSPFNCLYVDTGSTKALIDTGVGVWGGEKAPGSGLVASSLKASGVNPEEIDIVILTHAHPDHIGGICLDTGRTPYSRAKFIIHEEEWKFWSDPESRGRIGEKHPDFIFFVDRNLIPVEEKLVTVGDDEEIAPGIRMLASKGHTPGHCCVELTSGQKKLIFLSDATLHEIHVEHPDWHPKVDMDASEGESSRLEILKRAAAENAIVLGYHFPFPGIGTITKDADGFQFRNVRE